VPQANWLVNVGVGKESTWGTAVPITTFFSSPAPSFAEKQDPIFDKGLRGIRSETQSMSFGAGRTEISLPDQPFYANDSGHLLMALLGLDTLLTTGGIAGGKTGTAGVLSAGAVSITYTLSAGGAPIAGDAFRIGTVTDPLAEIVIPTVVSGAGPYTLTVPAIKNAHLAGAAMTSLHQHQINALNTGAPPSYTVAKYDALNTTLARTVAGVYFEEATVKFSNPGKMTIAVKGKGKMGTNVTKTTAVYSTEPFYVPWQCAFTIASVANARVTDMEFTLKAAANQVFGMNGTQQPTAAVADQLSITGKLTAVPDDYTEYNYYLQNTQPPISMLFDNGYTQTVFQFSKAAFTDPVTLDHSGNMSMISAAFEAISNSTDAVGASGNSPMKAILRNNQSALY
jgi:hypothetical protein